MAISEMNSRQVARWSVLIVYELGYVFVHDMIPCV